MPKPDHDLDAFNVMLWGMRGGLPRALKATEWAVYLAIAACLPNPRPGYDEIVYNSGVSERSAQQAVQTLVGVGLLTVAELGGGRGRANVYRLADIRNPEVVAAIIGKLGERDALTGTKKAKQDYQNKLNETYGTDWGETA